MFFNYISSAFRALMRHKVHAFINVLGLAIGLAACLLIILFVKFEISYDNFLPNIDRLYRIQAVANIPGRPSNDTANFFGTTYDLLPKDYPEVEALVRLQGRQGTIIKGSNSFQEEFRYTDPTFFTVFDLPIIEGNKKTALDSPEDIVLTREMAEKHLGPAPWVGKKMTINESFKRDHIVSAVIEDIPENSHLDIDIMVPIDKRAYEGTQFGGATDLTRWNGLPFFVYIKLKDGESIAPMKSTINAWVDKYFPENIIRLVNIKGSELFTPKILPVDGLHLNNPAGFDMKPRGSMTVIWSFTAIAVLIMLIAIINFTNLATAQSTLRAKEVSLRKVMGATRGNLFWQYELESVLYASFGLIVSLGILWFTLPEFADYTQRAITFNLLTDPVILASTIGLTLLVGLIAGAHPAMGVANSRPSEVLMANKSSSPASNRLRQALVILQFTISAALIIGTILIYAQTKHSMNLDLGYDRKGKFSIFGLNDPQIEQSAKETFKKRILDLPDVSKASLASFMPGNGAGAGLSLTIPGKQGRTIIFYRSVDYDFFHLYGVTPTIGRLFSPDHPLDKQPLREELQNQGNDDPQQPAEERHVNVLINEAAVKYMGFKNPADALDKVFMRGRNNEMINHIVGVIPNVHLSTPRDEIRPELYMYTPQDQGNLNLHLTGDNQQKTIENIQKIGNEMFPGVRLFTRYVDENIARQFREEEIQATLLAMFAGLAILIACMGLFGLASFTIARRTKEIGIRKVMGATTQTIVTLLLRQFSKPVVIANVLAWPLGYYAIDQWLQAFQFRIDLLPWFMGTCLAAMTLTLVIAWGTIAGHAYRVARKKPIKALRYE